MLVASADLLVPPVRAQEGPSGCLRAAGAAEVGDWVLTLSRTRCSCRRGYVRTSRLRKSRSSMARRRAEVRVITSTVAISRAASRTISPSCHEWLGCCDLPSGTRLHAGGRQEPPGHGSIVPASNTHRHALEPRQWQAAAGSGSRQSILVSLDQAQRLIRAYRRSCPPSMNWRTIPTSQRLRRRYFTVKGSSARAGHRPAAPAYETRIR